MNPIVGTSTKMNLTSSELSDYLDRLMLAVSEVAGVELFVLPPFTALWIARERLAGTGIAWGAQDVHPDDAGAHTGDVSAKMLADLGCRYVECGHSERRRDHGETDDLVARKVRRILQHRMVPILCVGEQSLGPTGAAVAWVTRQLESALAGLQAADVGRAIVAYEPVWAIGEGSVAADPAHVERVHLGIAEVLDRLAQGARRGRVIYGGSVDPKTARGLLECGGVDGLFVGRSALDPDNLAAIAAIAADVAGTRAFAVAAD